MSTFDIFLTIASHLIPVVLTILVLAIAVIFMIGSPYCRYVSLVSDAGSEKGKERLARHLAKETGGRKIDANQSWRAFLPAARDLYKKHECKKHTN